MVAIDAWQMPIRILRSGTDFDFHMTIIRTGMVCVPEWDEETVAAVSHELQSAAPAAHIILSTSVGHQRHWIEDVLRRWCDEEDVDLLLTVGETFLAPGPSARDVVPEATAAVLERPLPGLSQAMRTRASAFSRLALLDRGLAGIRSRTLIVNLPAGATAARLFLQAINELLEPIFAHLRSDPAAPHLNDVLENELRNRASNPDASVDSAPSASDTQARDENSSQSSGLDADEFAAFLRRRAAQSDSSL